MTSLIQTHYTLMAKKTKISQKDIEIFHAAMSGTAPLKQKKNRIPRVSSPPRKPSIKKFHPSFEEDNFNFDESLDLPFLKGEELMSFKQSGIANKILRKLSKGQYNVDAILDLHGKTIEEARIAVESFLKRCLRDELRVALIIHGKGRKTRMPILKNKLNHWLRQINSVLAFCSASPSNGDKGAIYVLLKRSRKESFVE